MQEKGALFSTKNAKRPAPGRCGPIRGPASEEHEHHAVDDACRDAEDNHGPGHGDIFAAMPVIKPSLLKSMAGETTALAKPVMGTRVPAPP